MARAAVVTVIVSLGLSTAVSAGPAGPTFQGDPQAIAEVQAVMQKFLATHTWKARMTSTGGGTSGTQTMEYVAPDRFHMVFQGTQASEMYMIGRETWMRIGGECQKLPVSPPAANPREMMEYSSDAKIAVTKGAPEPVDGIPTRTYVLIVDTQGKQLREKLYVTPGTGLPRRAEVRADQGMTVIDYFDYGAPITVNNPPC